MSIFGSAISEFGAAVDLLGAELGVSDATMQKFDSAVTGIETAADGADPLVALASVVIAGVAVAAIGPEALAAGVAADRRELAPTNDCCSGQAPDQPAGMNAPCVPPIEVEAYVTNDDIGFVSPGAPAVIKIDSFPYTR